MKRALTAEQRSVIMSSVRSKDTKPELLVRKYLHGLGLRYRLHNAKLPGKPDLSFPKYRTAIFVHGCFWHQHGCGKNVTPMDNTDYWGAKLLRNISRDAEAKQALEKLGWRVLVVWECELKIAARGATLAHLTANILGNECWIS
ncbi:very short patch repair endonuclease [Hymenobacter sp. PAMC 26628]|uniref:very short patch repair endonuclease n=1 Tax=Hymenobacter sp. PAMC 26628 TaxID=1484118 RepID=UPI0009020214|nr:very short patch repair endonuclease [Hymenobacter sp. PAMC 26628]